MEIFNSWQFNVLAYLVSIVLFAQYFKIAVKHAKHDGAATILFQVLAGISIAMLIPFFPFALPKNPTVYLFLIIACLFYGISDRLQTTARKHLQVSIYSIIFQLYNIFLLVYSFIIFKEPLVLPKVLGMVLIIGGNILLFYRRERIVFNKYLAAAIGSAFFSATAITIDINTSPHFSLPFYICLTFSLPALFVLLMERMPVREVLTEYKQTKENGKKLYVATSIFWAMTIFFALRSFQFGAVSTIIPLQATSVLLNVMVAFIFLHERDQKMKKFIAAALVVIGISLTVF